MNTSANNPNPLAKTLATALVLSVIGVLIMASRPSSSAAMQQRVFENKIPAHIPIKIKIKKEKEESFPAHWDPKLRIPRGQVVAAASIVSPKY